jgi:hypothetical protein
MTEPIVNPNIWSEVIAKGANMPSSHFFLLTKNMLYAYGGIITFCNIMLALT